MPNADSMTFQCYNLVPPSAKDDKSDHGEGEDSDILSEEEKMQDNGITGENLDASSVNFNQERGQIDPLYKENALNETVDPLIGITPTHYANIEKDVSRDNSLENKMRAYMNCEEFAVLAFWNLNEKLNLFECIRFFIVPNPMKRTIKDVNGSTQD